MRNVHQGGHGSGSREYSPVEYRQVCDWLIRQGQVTDEEIVSATGVGGRTVRAILSDADGVEFVLNLTDSGRSIARSADEADRSTARLASQAHKMQERVLRRREYTARELPRFQGALL